MNYFELNAIDTNMQMAYLFTLISLSWEGISTCQKTCFFIL